MDMVQAVFGSSPDSLRPQPVEKLISIFQEKGWLRFSHDEDLGELPGSKKILGEFCVEPFRIKVDRTLSTASPRFRFTLAHEIGHFCLHRRMIGKGKFISREQLPRDDEDHLRYREMAALSDLGWAEWQANEFAMALILPQFSLMREVVRIQREIGVMNNQGLLFFDDQPRNIMDCMHVTATLALHYQIPRGAIWKRLRYLGILQDRRHKNVRRTHEDMDSLFFHAQ